MRLRVLPSVALLLASLPILAGATPANAHVAPAAECIPSISMPKPTVDDRGFTRYEVSYSVCEVPLLITFKRRVKDSDPPNYWSMKRHFTAEAGTAGVFVTGGSCYAAGEPEVYIAYATLRTLDKTLLVAKTPRVWFTYRPVGYCVV